VHPSAKIVIPGTRLYGAKSRLGLWLLGKVAVPSAAQPFLAEIRSAKAQAVAEGKAEAKSEDKK